MDKQDTHVWRNAKTVVSEGSTAGDLMTQDLASYRKDVERVFSGSGQTVFNGTAAHARVVIEEGFIAAKDRVRLVAASLDRAIFSEDVARAANDFVARGGRIDLVLETNAETNTDTPLWSAILRGAQRGQSEVRVVNDGMISAYPFNCLTVDGTSYRYQQDRSLPVAVVGGGGALVETAQHLDRLIDQIKLFSEPVNMAVHRQPVPVT